MKQITEDYVSYEIAKLLKEKGFDESVNRFYEIYTCKPSLVRSEYCRNSFTIDYAAPTHQMTLKWLREVHEFIVTIDYDRYPVDNGESSIVGYGYNIQTKDNPEDYYRISESVYESYEEAVEAALKYALENLI